MESCTCDAQRAEAARPLIHRDDDLARNVDRRSVDGLGAKADHDRGFGHGGFTVRRHSYICSRCIRSRVVTFTARAGQEDANGESRLESEDRDA